MAATIRIPVAALLFALCVIGAPRAAQAFPELALRAGESRCSACHFAPAGGGLLDDYGREEAGDDLSRGGDGRFLNGALTPPDWLALGGDFRAAALDDDEGGTNGPTLAAFPMQADLRARVSVGNWSLVASAGPRGSTRLYKRSAWSYFASAEHYVMWREGPVGWYVRAGRFMPPMGLRLPDHTLYIRRYTGTGLYEEPYGLGTGYVADGWEVHATAFVHDPLLDVGAREKGGTVYVEKHGDSSALGVSSRVGVGPESTRILGGLVARKYLAGPDLVLLAEEDFIYERVNGSIPTARKQIVTYADVDWRPVKGINLAAWYEHYHEDLGQPGLQHDGLGAEVRYYPRAHWELILLGRWQLIGTDDHARLAMLQLHYYL